LITSAEFRDKNRDSAHTNVSAVVIKELDGPGSVRLFVDLSDHVIGLGIVRGLRSRGDLVRPPVGPSAVFTRSNGRVQRGLAPAQLERASGVTRLNFCHTFGRLVTAPRIWLETHCNKSKWARSGRSC
jgi:hypothetical protein